MFFVLPFPSTTLSSLLELLFYSLPPSIPSPPHLPLYLSVSSNSSCGSAAVTFQEERRKKETSPFLIQSSTHQSLWISARSTTRGHALLWTNRRSQNVLECLSIGLQKVSSKFEVQGLFCIDLFANTQCASANY